MDKYKKQCLLKKLILGVNIRISEASLFLLKLAKDDSKDFY